MNRLFRSSALVLSAVVLALVGAGACSYVTPPAMTMSRQGATDPFFSYSRDELNQAIKDQQTGASTPTSQNYDTTAGVARILTQKARAEVWRELLNGAHATVNDLDKSYAQQVAQQQGVQDQAGIDEYVNAEAYGRALAEEEIKRTGRDLGQLARDYYDKNRSAFTTQAQLCLHAMAFQAGDAGAKQAPSEADYAAALTKANEAKARTAAEPFEKVAGEVSDIKQQYPDGDVGCNPEQPLAQRLGQDITNRLRTLPKGTVADPERVPGGYYLFRVDNYIAETTPPFDQVRSKAEDAATRDLGHQLRGNRLRDEINKIDVTVDPLYGRWDRDQVAVVAPNGSQTPTVPTSSTTEPTLLNEPGGQTTPGSEPTGTTPSSTTGTVPPASTSTAAPGPSSSAATTTSRP